MERSRRAAGRLYEIHPGVLALTPTLPIEGRRAAALLWSDGWLSGLSLLALHGIAGEPATVHVTVVGRSREPVAGVTPHRTRGFARGDVTRVGAFAATTVGRALLDVAAATPEAVLRGWVHEAQYRRLIDPLTLRQIVERHPGHPGLAALRAIDPAPRRSESGLETRLGRLVARVPGPPPERQFWFTTASGRRRRADFAYVEQGVLIEADGRDAHARMLALDDDRVRDNDAAAAGWLTLRYTGRRMRDAPDAVVAEIAAVLVTRGAGR